MPQIDNVDRDALGLFTSRTDKACLGDLSVNNNNIIIIYSIYGALIPNGPKTLYIIKNNDKILNLQNYIVIL